MSDAREHGGSEASGRSSHPHVVVIGGGLAGLTATYELAKLGYAPLLLERGGHFGGKVMSSVGYGGMPIEHGVHGWWKGYGNFFDVLRELHGADWQRECFSGPYYSRFTAKMEDGRIVTMNRPAPIEGEPRVMPFVGAMAAMIKQGALSVADVASVGRLLIRAIGFEHVRDYDRWSSYTVGGVAEELGMSRRAQQLVLANFTLASAFSPLDRISASAFFSSLNFYAFDAQASLASRWLRTHPDELVHAPLCAAIQRLGGTVSAYTRVLGLERGKSGAVNTIFIDRSHTGVLDLADFHAEPRNLLDDAGGWRSQPHQLAIARATLRHSGQVWIERVKQGDEPDVGREPIAWTGDRAPPEEDDDRRWLEVEWADEAFTRVRIFEVRYETLGTIAATDVPTGTFREMLWSGRAGGELRTPPAQLEHLRANLARHAYLFTMHVGDLATPPHLPLYVGNVGKRRLAVAGICTHFGGRLRWDASLHSFACLLHGSRFDCEGQRTCGPAESDLFSFRLSASKRDSSMLDVQVRLPPRIFADKIVLSPDVSGLRRILQSSPTLHDSTVVRGMLRMRTTSVTVIRFPIGRRVDDTLSIFSGFDTLDALFNVTKLQGVQLDRYKDRTHEIIELQIYSEGTSGQLAREPLLASIKKELKEAYRWDEEPEILEPVHIAVHRDAYTSYDPESESVRPKTTAPGLEGIAFAGDWVQPDDGAWYMERAVRTGRLAARAIARSLGGDAERVPLVPPVREPWGVRTVLQNGEGGADRVLDWIHRLFAFHDTPY